MKGYEQLPEGLKQEIAKYPAYITLLAQVEVSAGEKTAREEALKFAQIRTYSSPPELHAFYEHAALRFEHNLQSLTRSLPADHQQRKKEILFRLSQLETLLFQYDETFATRFLNSMNSFREHLLQHEQHVLSYLIFPVTYSKVKLN